MKKTEITSLKEELLLVQLDSFTDKFDKEMGKMNKKSIKWFKIAFIPYGILCLSSLIIQNPVPFLIGQAYLAGTTIFKIISDGKEEEENIRRKYNPTPSKITEIDSPVPDFSFLNDPIVEKKNDDYYSDYYKELIERENKKFRVVSKNSEITPETKSNDQETEEFFNKEEAMIRIVKNFNIYCIAYKIPKYDIKPQEWDALFDVMYERLEEVSLESIYYDKMNFLLRYTLAYSLVHKKSKITINSFIDCLPIFEKTGLKELNIPSIIKEINNRLTSSNKKTINFEQALLHIKRKK